VSVDDRDFVWMQRALELASRAYELGEVPVGAVVVRNNQIIGEGFNQPIFAKDPSAHAEILALRDAATNQQNYRLPGASLYVTIEPCTMCFGAIVHARIRSVVFGAREPKAGVLESHSQIIESGIYNHQLEWRSGVCEEESTAIMQKFFQARRKENKTRGSLKN